MATALEHLNDGTLSILERVDILFKRDKSKVAVDPIRPFFQETLNIRPAVLVNQMWTQSIPTIVPSDLLALTESSLDDATSPSVIKGSTTGKASTSSTFIRRFIKVQLIHVSGANDLAYHLPTIFSDVIPFNHDPNGTYQVRLYKNSAATNSEAEIPFGETGGEWIINHEKAVITFFELDNVTDVSESLPPLVSYYKYVGTKGIAVTTDTVSCFNGGNGSCADAAVSICIDDIRGDLGTILGEGECSHSIQIGPNNCGSWRIIVVGNGDGSTSLHFQYRTATTDQWRTKFHVDPLDCDPPCT